MSVSRDSGSESPEGINTKVLRQFTSISSSPAPEGTTADNSGEGAFFTEEIDLPDNHILAIYGVRTYLGDVNEIVAGNPVDIWWYNEELTPNGAWREKMTYNDFLAFHEYAVHSGGTDNAPTGTWPNGLYTNFVNEFGLPVLNWTGDVTVQWEYLGGDHGEIAFELIYEFIEVDDDHLVKELTQRL